jgi:monomeric isocitrate dehydrogenase
MRRFIIFLLLAPACTSRSTSEQYCDRAQACNLLKPGISVEECVQDIDAKINQLPQTQRDELEYQVQQCLNHPACNGFASCVSAL